VNIEEQQRLKMSKSLYILEASLHGIMTVPKTHKYYSSNRVYSELQSIWKDSRIMIDVKPQLLAIVFPVLLYAAETWTVNKEDLTYRHSTSHHCCNTVEGTRSQYYT